MTVLDREEVIEGQDQETPDLIHMAETCCPPFERALCGESLIGQSELPDFPGQQPECVVCAEMSKTMVCPRPHAQRGPGRFLRPW